MIKIVIQSTFCSFLFLRVIICAIKCKICIQTYYGKITANLNLAFVTNNVKGLK